MTRCRAETLQNTLRILAITMTVEPSLHRVTMATASEARKQLVETADVSANVNESTDVCTGTITVIIGIIIIIIIIIIHQTQVHYG